MKFKTKVDWFFKFIILFVFLVLILGTCTIYSKEGFGESCFFGIIFLVILLFLIVSVYKTDFTFESSQIICKSIFWKVEIPYSKIKKIERQHSFIFAGWKMSTSIKGLIIYYNTYDELLISPENEDEFIIKLNSKIRQEKV